ncbi:FkbM family methyltransferase [Halotia wernerae UHCC 0503]|nr:FkbM family methyltransferase [Halotia wernerae UHCC 0503]
MISLQHYLKLMLQEEYRKKHLALKKLNSTPRYTLTTTNILGTEISLVDSASFIFMYKEILESQIYKFKTNSCTPIIIDAGANIGLSTLYFKQLYPQSKIIAFEPDTRVFAALKENIAAFSLTNVDLVNKAVWSSETILKFMSEGADAGRIVQVDKSKEIQEVSTIRLRDYLNQKVDFLKIDIEGAETEVINDCQDLLINVDNLFVEYHSFVNQPQTLSNLIDILSRANFRFYIDAPIKCQHPFYEHGQYMGMDQQLNIFAFRN